MLLYLAFLLVFLTTSEVTNHRKAIDAQNFTDLYKNGIDINSYCDDDKPCVIKCCGEGQVIDHNGVCDDATQYKSDNYDLTYYNISVFIWNDDSGTWNRTNKKLHNVLAFVRNEMFSNSSLEIVSPENFKIIEDGSLKVKFKNSKYKWIHVAPLDFCLEYRPYTTKNDEEVAAVVFKFANGNQDRNRKSEALGKIKFAAGGMLISSVALILIVYRMPQRIRSVLAPLLVSFAISIMMAYILKTSQLSAVIAGIMNFSKCKTFSPVLYFFILSSFLWTNIIFYDLWWRLWSYRKKSRSIVRKDNCIRLICYSLVGWGIPSIMTIGAVSVDVYQLDKIWSVEKPPFDSCFANEKQTMIYMHVPIAVMTFTEFVLFLMSLYNIYALSDAISNSPHYKLLQKSIVTTKHRVLILCIKLALIIGVFCLLLLIPDVPVMLYIIINAYSICIGNVLFLILITRNPIFTKLCNRFNPNSLVHKFQASQFLEKITTKAVDAKIIKGLNNNNEDKKNLTTSMTDEV